eukprot:scaffold6871_cov75-Phaeocystis_antarctica.AAC.4
MAMQQRFRLRRLPPSRVHHHKRPPMQCRRANRRTRHEVVLEVLPSCGNDLNPCPSPSPISKTLRNSVRRVPSKVPSEVPSVGAPFVFPSSRPRSPRPAAPPRCERSCVGVDLACCASALARPPGSLLCSLWGNASREAPLRHLGPSTQIIFTYENANSTVIAKAKRLPII